MSIIKNGKARHEKFVVSRDASQEDYINAAKELYVKKEKAEYITKNLTKYLEEIRAQGFKLIIIGNEVRVTY